MHEQTSHQYGPPERPTDRAVGVLVNRGFTLIELLVVLAIIAIGTAGVSLSMRDSAQSALERDAQRLAALLDAARTRSRASGVPVLWRTQMQGDTQRFVFEGLPGAPLPTQWLDAQTRSLNPAPVLLGPEPLIGAQSVALSSANPTNTSSSRLWVRTDGLRPFTVQTSPP
jgi:general secretion pathway protein H